MIFFCLGFGIWWKASPDPRVMFSHLCRGPGYGSEWTSLLFPPSKCSCGVQSTTAAALLPSSFWQREVACWLSTTHHTSAQLPPGGICWLCLSASKVLHWVSTPGRQWFVPWPQELQDLFWVGAEHGEWGQTPPPSSLHRGLPSDRTHHLLTNPWDPSNPLVNTSKDKQQELKGLFPPLWVKPACLSSHVQGEGFGQAIIILFCFSSIVPDMMRSTSAKHAGLVVYLKGWFFFFLIWPQFFFKTVWKKWAYPYE